MKKTKHAEQRSMERKITDEEIAYVLRCGKIEKTDHECFRISKDNLSVVVSWCGVIVTAYKNDKRVERNTEKSLSDEVKVSIKKALKKRRQEKRQEARKMKLQIYYATR